MTLHTSTRTTLLNAAKANNIKFVKCLLQRLLWADLANNGKPDQHPVQERWDNSEAGALLELDDQDLLDVLCSEDARSVLTQNRHDSKTISHIDVLHYAVQRNELDVATYLLDHANINVCKKLDGKPPLLRCRSVDMAKLLLEHGADIEGEDRNGNTPLARCSDIEIAKLLLSYRADVDAINRMDETVLSRVAWRGRSDLVALLLEHGAVTWPDNTKSDSFFDILFEKHIKYINAKRGTPRMELKMLMLSLACTKKGYEKNCAVRKMLENPESRRVLLGVLKSPVLVACQKSSAVGENIRWNLRLGAGFATDRSTGQKLELTQVIFKESVTVYLPTSSEYSLSAQHRTFQVQGSTEEVLNEIQHSLRNVSYCDGSLDHSRSLWFRKLSLANDGRYKLYISVT
jgi:ankyrin repeat protein